MENLHSMGDQFLANVNRIIEENLDNEHFSVEDLARHAGLSRSMLHRKLIKLTGKSASDLITEKRLLRAKELLENDTGTASEIAYKVGFGSPSYFHRVFKKYFNISPGDVRKGTTAYISQPDTAQKPESNDLAGTGSRRSLTYILFIVIIVIIAAGTIFFLSRNKKPVENSIAVLPVQNLTGQTDNAYFVDGMQEALVGELGRISSLRVISRTSTQKYRDRGMLLKDIAKELGVNNIVEGSVFCLGDSICFLVQLIDVFPKERHILTNEYHDNVEKVLTVQSSVVKDIAQKIRIKLTKEEEQRLTKPRTVNPETYKAYLRGVYYLHQGTRESFQIGINYLQEAIDRDPGDPLAYAGLALGYATMGHGQFNTEEAFLRAMSAANKAVKLDPTADEAHTALAILYSYKLCDWPKSKEFFENALANNPNNEIAHFHFAWYYVVHRDLEKAMYHNKKAVMLEPFSAYNCCHLALLYWYNNEYDEAEFWAKKALRLKENIPYGNVAMSWTCLRRKQYRQAVEFIENLPENHIYYKMLRGHIYAKTGNREKALQYWDELEEYSKDHYVNPCYTGMMASYLGFTDKAFELLNKACDHKEFPVAFINFYPATEDIRKDPRFDQLLRKMNLPPQK